VHWLDNKIFLSDLFIMNRELVQHVLFFPIGVSEPSIQLDLKRHKYVTRIHDET